MLVLTQENFKAEVLESQTPVLVDFWATWCPPCKAIAPIVEEIEGENPGLKVCKLNVDDVPSVAAAYGINSIPTLLVFEKGQITHQVVGYRPKAELLAAIGGPFA